jgi:hypothetical protein
MFVLGRNDRFWAREEFIHPHDMDTDDEVEEDNRNDNIMETIEGDWA